MRISVFGTRSFTILTVMGVAAIVTLAVKAPAAHATSQAPTGGKTVWDGSYTEAQATRGREAYLKECAPCHADNLQGGDEAPGLAGSGFLAQWTDLSAGDLVERTRMTMPQDRPGQLSRATYVDIITYLFKVNGFPAGSEELPTESGALKGVMIAAQPAK
jgi:mono/diheme cytochrome c family protein